MVDQTFDLFDNWAPPTSSWTSRFYASGLNGFAKLEFVALTWCFAHVLTSLGDAGSLQLQISTCYFGEWSSLWE